LFNIGTAKDNKTLLFEFPDEPWISHLNVKIDDVVYSNDSCRTNARRLPMIVDPHIVDNSIICTWQVNDVIIEQQLTPEQYSESTGAILIQYEITNNDDQPHQVGLLLIMDTMINCNDSAAVATNYGYSNTAQQFVAPNIPDYFQAFEKDPVTPGLIAQGTLKGGKAVPPDVFIVGYWPELVSVAWDFSPGSGLYEDSAVLLHWNEKPLAPGEIRIIATYFGIGEVTVAPGKLSLNVSSPNELQYIDSQLDPNPFFIYLTVTNTGFSQATDVQATLRLPQGLNLPENETTTKGMSPANNNLLAPDSSRLVSWKVNAAMPRRDTTLLVTIDVTSSNTEANAISRQLFVPAPYALIVDPKSQTVTAGDSCLYTIFIQNASGFGRWIGLSVSGLPEYTSSAIIRNRIDPMVWKPGHWLFKPRRLRHQVIIHLPSRALREIFFKTIP